MSKVLINDEYLHDIANSIRKMKRTNNLITTDSMAGEIETIDIGYDPKAEWQRPIEFPDLSQISLENFDGMYFTYDTTYNGAWCGLQATVTGGYVCQRGQIVNGEFVVDKTTNVASGSNYIEMLPYTLSGYVVYKIYAQNTANHITRIGQVGLTAAASETGITDVYWNQPILERYGRLPSITSLYQWTNIHVKSDTILDMAAINTFSSTWNTCYEIENIDLTGFTGRPTTLYYAFRQCFKLRYLKPTDKFVTSACTSLNSAFATCINLPVIDTTGWDTSNVITFTYAFSNCTNLYKLDVSNFNTANATNMSYMFEYCYKLRELDVSNFNTENVTNFTQMFRALVRLEELNVSNFDTAKATSMSYMFASMYILKELDVSNFNTELVTNISNMFYGDRALESLDLSNFNVSKVTDMSYMFQYCSCLETLNLSGWNLDVVTTARRAFEQCFMLKDFISTNMTVENTLKASNCVENLFNSCNCVQRVDLDGWDLSDIPSALGYTFRYCYAVKEIILPESFNKGITSYCFANCNSLTTLVLKSPTVVPLATTNAFGSTPTTKKIYVPDELVDDYKVATNWKSVTCTFVPLSEYQG